MANWLLSRGVRPLDHVCLVVENTPQFLVVWMACGRIGAAASFINFNLRGGNLSHCLNLSEARCVIVDANLAQFVKDIEGTLKAGDGGKLDIYAWGSSSLYPNVNFDTLKHVSDAKPANAYGGANGSPDDTVSGCLQVTTLAFLGLTCTVFSVCSSSRLERLDYQRAFVYRMSKSSLRL